MPPARKMKRIYLVDTLINVIAPLLGGVLLYYLKPVITMRALISGQLADGLWAYAFMSSILIIWDRRVTLLWMLMVVLTASVFEWMQYKQWVPGTADMLDFAAYILFFSIAWALNPLFRKLYKIRS